MDGTAKTSETQALLGTIPGKKPLGHSAPIACCILSMGIGASLGWGGAECINAVFHLISNKFMWAPPVVGAAVGGMGWGGPAVCYQCSCFQPQAKRQAQSVDADEHVQRGSHVI